MRAIKSALFLLLLALLAFPAAAAITQVQKKGDTTCENTSSVTTFGCTYTSSVTAGNELFALIRLGSTNTGIAISDNVNAGNWTQAFLAHDATNNRWVGLFYKENTLSGTITVTVSWSVADASAKGLDIMEYSGLATSSSLDGTPATQVNTTATATPSAGPTTTTSANDLLIGAIAISNGDSSTTMTEDSNFTNQFADTYTLAAHSHLNVGTRIVSSTGNYSYAPVPSASVTNLLGIAAFKGAVQNASPTLTLSGQVVIGGKVAIQ